MAGAGPAGRADAARRLVRALRADAGFMWQARVLPGRVRALQVRARLRARREGDRFSLVSATRPPDLQYLLSLARGRRRVVELGTGTAWTTIALALADDERTVRSFDPELRRERERYLDLMTPADRRRIELVTSPGAAGPRAGDEVDLLYVDSSHSREDVIAEVRAWTPVLVPGALIVLDDYGHPLYPGVAEGVAELGLTGAAHGTLFVHVHPPTAAGAGGETA